MNIRGVERTILQMPYNYNGNNSSVPIAVYEHTGKDPSPHIKPVLVIPGVGEEGFVAAGVLRELHRQNRKASVGVFLFPDRNSIDYICKAGPEFLASRINKDFGDHKDAPVNTLSHSGMAGALVIAAHNTPQLEGARHALIAPAGPNSPYMHNQLQYFKRMASNLKEQGQLSPRNWRIAADITKRLVDDTVFSMARNQYMLFLYKLKYAFDTEQHDGFKENLAWMGQHSDVAIITGTKDRMFPHEQGHSVLSLAGVNGNINYIDVDGAHESMACELGLGQVGIGFDWIENVAYLQHA